MRCGHGQFRGERENPTRRRFLENLRISPAFIGVTLCNALNFNRRFAVGDRQWAALSRL